MGGGAITKSTTPATTDTSHGIVSIEWLSEQLHSCTSARLHVAWQKAVLYPKECWEMLRAMLHASDPNTITVTQSRMNLYTKITAMRHDSY